MAITQLEEGTAAYFPDFELPHPGAHHLVVEERHVQIDSRWIIVIGIN